MLNTHVAKYNGTSHSPIVTTREQHSAHGPILRDAVQKLLKKRGMRYRLGTGGGAFQVDALSGWDLYDPGPATTSKVVVAEESEFHEMAYARGRGAPGNFASGESLQLPVAC